MKNPLMFLRVEELQSSNGWIDYKWVPVDKSISGAIKLGRKPSSKYTLVVAQQTETEEKNETPGGLVKFSTRYLDLRKTDDCKLVINSLILRSHDTEDKYPYIRWQRPCAHMKATLLILY